MSRFFSMPQEFRNTFFKTAMIITYCGRGAERSEGGAKKRSFCSKVASAMAICFARLIQELAAAEISTSHHVPKVIL
ncbi:MAG: hypothetical protein IPM97_00055 [Bdellovibrionaceae bacterium]|nr:hypothetical protein [Pseudobdellovibrionaceae bacterium]